MAEKKKSITRLILYNKALTRLKQLGFHKVFSDNLADATGINPAQIRKDFSIFNISGSKKGGYIIDDILPRIREILSKGKPQEVVIIGAGNLGMALLRYKGFEKEGIHIKAAFDIVQEKIVKNPGLPLYPMSELESFVQQHGIKVAIMAVPEHAAQGVLDHLINAGIVGILNFAPVRLRATKNCYINNVNLENELEKVIYFARVLESGHAIGSDLEENDSCE